MGVFEMHSAKKVCLWYGAPNMHTSAPTMPPTVFFLIPNMGAFEMHKVKKRAFLGWRPKRAHFFTKHATNSENTTARRTRARRRQVLLYIYQGSQGYHSQGPATWARPIRSRVWSVLNAQCPTVVPGPGLFLPSPPLTIHAIQGVSVRAPRGRHSQCFWIPCVASMSVSEMYNAKKRAFWKTRTPLEPNMPPAVFLDT